MRDHGYLVARHGKLRLKSRLDVIRVTNDRINHPVKSVERPLVRLARIVRKQIVNRQNNLRAPPLTDLNKP